MNKPERLSQPEVTRTGLLDMQVCVPEDYTDEQVVEFAERENSCGTSSGWHIRKSGDEALGGQPERNPCSAHSGKVHIMLDA